MVHGTQQNTGCCKNLSCNDILEKPDPLSSFIQIRDFSFKKFVTLFSFFLLIPFSAMAQWEQLGDSFNGDMTGYQKGYSISFSSDGATVAIGVPLSSSSGFTSSDRSYVQVFRWNEGSWEQLGENILGGEHFLGPPDGSTTSPPMNGSDVALSSDGNIVVMAEHNYYYVNPDNESEVLFNPRARVFEYVDGVWQQIGEDIYGSARTVAISADGSIVAIGSNYDGTVATQSGIVRVYQNQNDDWVQLGGTFYGTISLEGLGTSIDLSSDGSVLAIGATGGEGGGLSPNPGYVKIYNLQGNEWELTGTLIGLYSTDGFGRGSYFGSSVSLSEDGYIVAVGSSQYRNSSNVYTGNVRVFKNVDGDWEQVGDTLEGAKSTNENTKHMVALSGDGNVLAFGTAGSSFPPPPSQGKFQIYQNVNDDWQLLQTINPAAPEEQNLFGSVISLSSDGSILGLGISQGDPNGIQDAGIAKVYQDCSLSKIAVNISEPDAFCSGSNTTLTAEATPEYYSGSFINWYSSADATEPVFTGTEYETPALTETTSYWVEAVTATGCTSERVEVVVTVNPAPELIIENTEVDTCEGASATLTVTSDGTVNWYDSQDATEPVFTGNTFTTPPLTNSTTYYVEAQSGEGCVSERTEITVTVLPAPVLEVENMDIQVCSGNDAYLYAFSEGNVIFWYANEDDTEYVYHGNNFIIEGLTESTSYWVEAYNLSTGCRSERVEVTVTVNPVPDAPVAVEVQQVEEGTTLADLEVEADGELTWYADEALTIVLPETTPVEDDTTYWVTQTINGCESAATGIFVEQLGTSDINNAEFIYWPNPVKDKLNFDGKETVESVQVFDMSGRLLMDRQSATGITQLDVTVLSKGTYIVKAQTDKEVKTFKIVKN